jgi:hypothetical protein
LRADAIEQTGVHLGRFGGSFGLDVAAESINCIRMIEAFLGSLPLFITSIGRRENDCVFSAGRLKMFGSVSATGCLRWASSRRIE